MGDVSDERYVEGIDMVVSGLLSGLEMDRQAVREATGDEAQRALALRFIDAQEKVVRLCQAALLLDLGGNGPESSLARSVLKALAEPRVALAKHLAAEVE